MSDLDAALAESRAALEQLSAAAERCGARWSTPRAEGKWSPEGRARLRQAHDAFEQAARAAAARFNHGIFGGISTADYVRFQALHTRHHTK